MAFQWWDYLDLADELLRATRSQSASKDALREARLRAVISRAYYAALLATSESLARAHGFKMPAHASHHTLKQELMRHENKIPAYKAILSFLTNLQASRTVADYHPVLPAHVSLDVAAEEAVSDAMDVRAALRAARRDSN